MVCKEERDRHGEERSMKRREIKERVGGGEHGMLGIESMERGGRHGKGQKKSSKVKGMYVSWQNLRSHSHLCSLVYGLVHTRAIPSATN